MAYHFDLNTWGHLGVTIFFVLSGFLITSILIEQRHQKLGHYLAVFYQRRSLRIFPLYYAYVLALGLAFLFVGRPLGFDTNWPYLITYTTNFAPLDPNWFTSAFYGHLWSLGVEEQLYLLWPFLIYFLSPKGSKVLMVALLVTCPLIRMVMYAVLSDVAPAVEAVGSAGAIRAEEVLDGLPVSCWDAFAAGALTIGFGGYLLSEQGAGLSFAPGELLHAVMHERLAGYTLRNFWIVGFLIAALEWEPLRRLLSLPRWCSPGRSLTACTSFTGRSWSRFAVCFRMSLSPFAEDCCSSFTAPSWSPCRTRAIDGSSPGSCSGNDRTRSRSYRPNG